MPSPAPLLQSSRSKVIASTALGVFDIPCAHTFSCTIDQVSIINTTKRHPSLHSIAGIATEMNSMKGDGSSAPTPTISGSIKSKNPLKGAVEVLPVRRIDVVYLPENEALSKHQAHGCLMTRLLDRYIVSALWPWFENDLSLSFPEIC
jgi:hypothetical protein